MVTITGVETRDVRFPVGSTDTKQEVDQLELTSIIDIS